MLKVVKNISQLGLLITATVLMSCGGNSTTNTDTGTTTGSTTDTGTDDTAPTLPESDWKLVWSDEFSEDSISTSNWTHEVNCIGGGNNEKQCYTEAPENSYVSDGTLKLVALPAAEGAELPYTSARLISKNKADFIYGRFEMSAKLPSGQGSWPAFWLLPTDEVYGGWPNSGEIDILESVNLNTIDDDGVVETRIHGTLHYGEDWPNNSYSGSEYHLPNSASPADDFHLYAIEWQAGEIRWYVDNYLYATQRKSEVLYNANDEAAGLTHKGWFSEYDDDSTGELTTHWDNSPFDQEFFMILNHAVGGNWPESTNNLGVDATAFENGKIFEIDYIRVYQCQQNTNTGQGCETIRSGYDSLDDALIEGQAPTPTVSSGIAENLTIYDGELNPNWPAWDCCGGSTPSEVDDDIKGNSIEFYVGETSTVNGFISRELNITDVNGSATPFDASGIAATGTLSFEMLVVSAPEDAGASWTFKIESIDADTQASFSLIQSNEGLAPVTGEWQTYTFNVSDFPDAGLDINAIDVVMVFPTWGLGNGAVYRISKFEISADITSAK